MSEDTEGITVEKANINGIEISFKKPVPVSSLKFVKDAYANLEGAITQLDKFIDARTYIRQKYGVTAELRETFTEIKTPRKRAPNSKQKRGPGIEAKAVQMYAKFAGQVVNRISLADWAEGVWGDTHSGRSSIQATISRVLADLEGSGHATVERKTDVAPGNIAFSSRPEVHPTRMTSESTWEWDTLGR